MCDQAACCRPLHVPDLLSFRQSVAVITKWQPIAVIALSCELRRLECKNDPCSAHLFITDLYPPSLRPIDLLESPSNIVKVNDSIRVTFLTDSLIL